MGKSSQRRTEKSKITNEEWLAMREVAMKYDPWLNGGQRGPLRTRKQTIESENSSTSDEIVKNQYMLNQQKALSNANLNVVLPVHQGHQQLLPNGVPKNKFMETSKCSKDTQSFQVTPNPVGSYMLRRQQQPPNISQVSTLMDRAIVMNPETLKIQKSNYPIFPAGSYIFPPNQQLPRTFQPTSWRDVSVVRTSEILQMNNNNDLNVSDDVFHPKQQPPKIFQPTPLRDAAVVKNPEILQMHRNIDFNVPASSYMLSLKHQLPATSESTPLVDVAVTKTHKLLMGGNNIDLNLPAISEMFPVEQQLLEVSRPTPPVDVGAMPNHKLSQDRMNIDLNAPFL